MSTTMPLGSDALAQLRVKRSMILHALAPISTFASTMLGSSATTIPQAAQIALGVLGVAGTYAATPRWLKVTIPYLTAVLVALVPLLPTQWQDLSGKALAPALAHVIVGLLVGAFPNVTAPALAPLGADAVPTVTTLPAQGSAPAVESAPAQAVPVTVSLGGGAGSLGASVTIAPAPAAPAPAVTEPAPAVADPEPVVADPEPVVADPEPVVAEPVDAVDVEPDVTRTDNSGEPGQPLLPQSPTYRPEGAEQVAP